MLVNGLPQSPLVLISAPRVETKLDVAGGELGHVENGTVAVLLEEDADHAAAVVAAVVEEDDMEWSSADAVAMEGNVDDFELHGRAPFALASRGSASRPESSEPTNLPSCQRSIASSAASASTS